MTDQELPPRRAQIRLTERDLKKSFGLRHDERRRRVGYRSADGYQMYFDGEPPIATLPLFNSYEHPGDGAETHQTQEQLT